MKQFLLILFFVPIIGFAQSNYSTIAAIPEATQAYWYYQNYAYATWKTEGWNPADTNSAVFIWQGGNGETTAPEMWTVPPLSYVLSGAWNGKIVKNNGDVVKWLFIGVRDTAKLNAVYTIIRNMIGQVVTSNSIDTTNMPDWRFVHGGLSDGANMANRVKVANGGSGHAWSNMIKRYVHAAGPMPYGTSATYARYNGSRVRIHTTTTDTNAGTATAYSYDLQEDIEAASNALVSVIVHPYSCHCAWNHALPYTGLNDPPGTHSPTSSEWRILVDDVEYVPPVVGPKIRLRIKE